ncbi:AI-2E family transporter [Mucilaginibacter conchicola]|uniref:AI-2E family transporter n=1 Tax=Mucilaginibacter conchicola TaxID=2303333 RepID=A0A372NSF4_9SPHI|nr:AI-2E family transporter [Mucilaginibacter conchicola]RFZ91285.1 AI-2E family transporter [Mucilaginibacter conchicola]
MLALKDISLNTTTTLSRAIQYLFLLFLILSGLYFTAGILMPVALAGILAMLFLPFSRWLEQKGINRTVGAVICIVLLLLTIGLLVFLFSWRVSNLQANVEQIERQVRQYTGQLQQLISEQFGVSKQQQEQLLKKQGSSGAGNAAGIIVSFASGILGSLTTAVLVLIYVFLFISARKHFRNFILKLVKPADEAKTTRIIKEASGAAQNYVSGLAKMILCLWVMYGIGFSVVGVQNAFFFAILCGTLEIVPFVGNVTGTTLTVLMALAQGGGGGMVLSVLVTYGLVQFIQSYILQPLVVGKDVDINPFFSIFVLVLGEALWGIGGMVLAIPLLGMLKIVFDHIETLKPYGYLIGNGDEKKQDKPLTAKIKSWFKR